MKILIATGEFAPLAFTGELGAQVRTLAAELKKLGHDVSIVIPFYRSVREGNYDIRPTGVEFQVNLGAKRAATEIFETQGADQIQVFLVRRDEYFDRSAIYSANGRAYEDNAERFIFFSKSVIELGRRLAPSPDIIHEQKTIYGSWVTSTWLMEELVERLVRWHLHPADLITHRFPLERVSEAYALMSSGKCGKVAVCWDEELPASTRNSP